MVVSGKTTDGTRRKGASLVSGVESDLSKERLPRVYSRKSRSVCAPAHKAKAMEGRSGSLDPNNSPCSTYQVTDWMSLVISFISCRGDATYVGDIIGSSFSN
jgi:hypothetical protein